MSRKRDREDDIQIKVALGQPIDAESLMLRPFSSVARALPSDTQQWDVSGLLLDGQDPFSRETVQCWLSCIYSSLHGPEELSAEDCEQLSTASGLRQVLAFAHAVGSPRAVLTAACSQLGSLKFVVTLPAQTIEVQMRDGPHGFGIDDGVLLEDSKQLKRITLLPSDGQSDNLGSPFVSEAECREVQQQVARQVGSLLHMAHVTQLQALIEALHSFVLWNTRKDNSLLWGVMKLVLTDAVLRAATGSNTLSVAAYTDSVLAQPLSMGTLTSQLGLSKPLGVIQETEDGELVFAAQLLRGVAGAKAGETVGVVLDLFDPDGGFIDLSIDGNVPVHLPAQLLVGHTTTSPKYASLLSGKLGPQT